MKAIEWFSLLTLAVLVLMPDVALCAGQAEPGEHDEAPAHEAGAAEHEFHQNHLSLFLGAATHMKHDDTGFAVGLDHEHRFTRSFGIGGIFEYAISDLERTYLLLVPVSAHPAGGLRLTVAPGVEFASVEVESHAHEGGEEEEDETEFALRFGLSYDFELARFTLAPEFDVDLIGGYTTLVYGMAFGTGF